MSEASAAGDSYMTASRSGPVEFAEENRLPCPEHRISLPYHDEFAHADECRFHVCVGISLRMSRSSVVSISMATSGSAFSLIVTAAVV